MEACQASLRRLGTDHLDMYLLHWRGRVPRADTVAAFEELVQAGLIRGWGVSNLGLLQGAVWARFESQRPATGP